jgi:hypothetical protein
MFTYNADAYEASFAPQNTKEEQNYVQSIRIRSNQRHGNSNAL